MTYNIAADEPSRSGGIETPPPSPRLEGNTGQARPSGGACPVSSRRAAGQVKKFAGQATCGL